MNQKEVRSQTSLSFPAINKAMETLAKLQIVREITGGKRHRVFAYHKYLELISQGTETSRK